MIEGLGSLVTECDRIAEEVAEKVNEALEY